MHAQDTEEPEVSPTATSVSDPGMPQSDLPTHFAGTDDVHNSDRKLHLWSKNWNRFPPL